ncbi:hypothetical protein C4564_06355 [Candidatus Microgenomates bacterium]|nr:MAG: hypothetical protein C4564_06355 [Candidatus Microgenomates bacterium]
MFKIKTSEYSNLLIITFFAILAMVTILVSDNLRQNTQTGSSTQTVIAWEKYKKDNISFEYPSNMRVVETPLYGANITIVFNNIDTSISEEMRPRIQIYKVEEPIGTVVAALNNSRNKDQFPELSEIEIGNKSAYQTKAIDPQIIFTHTVLGNENTTYLFEMFSSEVKNNELQNAYEHVVETFNL